MNAQIKAGTNGPLVEVFTKGPDGRACSWTGRTCSFRRACCRPSTLPKPRA